MPEAEIADMIVEIRSVTQGVGTFRTEFDHLQELAGRDGRAHRRGDEEAPGGLTSLPVTRR